MRLRKAIAHQRWVPYQQDVAFDFAFRQEVFPFACAVVALADSGGSPVSDEQERVTLSVHDVRY